MRTITLKVGDVLAFPKSPDGIGQIDDLHRTRCTVVYRRKGRLCRARVPASEIAERMAREPLLIQAPNLLGRAAWPRQKTFNVA